MRYKNLQEVKYENLSPIINNRSMRKYIFIGCLFFTMGLPSYLFSQADRKDYSFQVDSILGLMTLEEKVGQMIQYSDDRLLTGPSIHNTDQFVEIKNGRVGSMFNVMSVERIKSYQDIAMQSRLKIPLIFGLDVVHGMKTTFPIPLAEAASFDLSMMEQTARIAAAETSAYGIHWTFAPMVDISRDARWGRVMEGAGEDSWLGSQIAKARIKGFQGENYNDANRVMACAKHFAAYGATVAGKDYSESDISETTLHQIYLPPFRAAVEANVATMMNGFNEINGIPANAHKELQRDILKEKWMFKGFMVSDWGSIGEIATHGMAKDNKEAAKLAVLAGCDMDMHSMSYKRNLTDLVKEEQIDIQLIDDAVKRILTKKYELGLFDDPYRYCYRKNELDDASIIEEYRLVARQMGAKSIVLLKNKDVLPIQPDIKKIALVGPLNRSRIDMLGNWNAAGEEKDVISIYEGLCAAMPDTEITYIEGYDLETNELKSLPDITHFDMIIVSLGESALESGEARSKVDINVNANQQALVRRIKGETNKPVVMLLMGGRPLIFSEAEPFADAIAMAWWLGSEAGNSISDVLTGKYNPSGRLPITFPRHVGQCPIYYNHKNTGRPWKPNEKYVSGYMDEAALPAYPFGFGLSYTQFEIGKPTLEKTSYTVNEPIKIQVRVKNTGKRRGIETVQLYLRDVVSSITRPVIELCGMQQIELKPEEEKWLEFTILPEALGFYNKNEFRVEPGEFYIFAGNSSQDLRKQSFYLTE